MLPRIPPALAALPLALLCAAAGCAYNLTPEDERRFEEYRRQNRSYGMFAPAAVQAGGSGRASMYPALCISTRRETVRSNSNEPSPSV